MLEHVCEWFYFNNGLRQLPDLVPSSPSSPRKSRDIAELDGTEERSQIPSFISRSFISYENIPGFSRL